MLRLNNQIRLNQTEQSVFAELSVDSTKAPTTVEENNRRAQLAAKTWAETGTAEGDLLASLAEDLFIAA
jgi:hypothetical protein